MSGSNQPNRRDWTEAQWDAEVDRGAQAILLKHPDETKGLRSDGTTRFCSCGRHTNRWEKKKGFAAKCSACMYKVRRSRSLHTTRSLN